MKKLICLVVVSLCFGSSVSGQTILLDDETERLNSTTDKLELVAKWDNAPDDWVNGYRVEIYVANEGAIIEGQPLVTWDLVAEAESEWFPRTLLTAPGWIGNLDIDFDDQFNIESQGHTIICNCEGLGSEGLGRTCFHQEGIYTVSVEWYALRGRNILTGNVGSWVLEDDKEFVVEVEIEDEGDKGDKPPGDDQ